MTIPEEVCIERAVRGDKYAFAHLAATHRPQAFRLALALLGDDESAEDIAQELLVRLAAALPGFRHESDLRTWVYRVTLNLCRDHLRRIKRHRRNVRLDDVAPGGALTTEPNPARRIDAERAVAAVRSAIEALPDDQREAISLRFLTDLPYKEISKMTDTPMGTVASRVFRGLQRLGQELEARHLEVLK